MKSKYLFTFALLLFTYAAFSQDTTFMDRLSDSAKYQYLQKVNINKSPAIRQEDSQVRLQYSTPKTRYRPTRLGNSSPMYNTYKKNKYGAGAITTNPNKSSGSPVFRDQLPSTEKIIAPRDTSALKHQ